MNEQLTLKELAAYLPYDVIFQSSMDIPFDDNGSHIGAVGDLEYKTSDYRYTSLDALPFNLPLQPLLL